VESKIICIFAYSIKHIQNNINTMTTTINKPTIEILISNEAQMIIDILKGAISKSPTGVSFISIKEYKNQYGEISNQTINIGKNLLKNAQLKDVETLKELDITTLNTKSDKVTLELARTEMINSFTNPDKTRSNGQINAYTHITEGLKVHNQSAEIYVYGLRIRKETIIEGVYPTVNSKPLTVAKNELKTLLKSSKYVQLKVSEMIGLTGNKETLEFKA